MNGYAQHYQNNQIATASREQILIMLYDGAIRFSKQAKLAIENNDQANKGKFIGKTVAIVTEFSNSLNHDVGGDIAANLDALYNFMLNELSRANINNDTGPIDTVCRMLCELRATWAEAIEINNSENQANASSSEQATIRAL